MRKDERDRMARGRDRAEKLEVKKSLPPAPPEVKPAREVVLKIPVRGMICPCCGRGMQPRVVRGKGANARVMLCTLCAGKFLVTYRAGKPAFARPLK